LISNLPGSPNDRVIPWRQNADLDKKGKATYFTIEMEDLSILYFLDIYVLEPHLFVGKIGPSACSIICPLKLIFA
jgi:hypothetical protein